MRSLAGRGAVQREHDKLFMQRALELASRGEGRTSPNPAVGAVIVRDGRILAEGYHKRAGGPHAEIAALREAAQSVRGATVYINLEPCSHHGRTPPWTDALKQAEVARVVIGMVDPNPLVAGRGIRRLRRAGIEVTCGVLRPLSLLLNEDFIAFIQTGRPFVTLKLAASLDGRIATADGDSRWISGGASRRAVHRLRNRVDAVVVGAETVRRDDPRLTCRIRGGRDPMRVVLDARLSISPTSRVCTLRSSAPTLILTSGVANAAKMQTLQERVGVEVVPIECHRNELSFPAVLKELGRRGDTHVLIEGGGQVAASAIREGVVDKLVVFYGPLLLGSEGRAMVGPLRADRVAAGVKLRRMKVEQLEQDLVVTAYLR